MNTKFLQEYITRFGIVTQQEVAEQAGASRDMLLQPAISLVEQKELFLCRLDHGRETFVSRHLLFCMSAVYYEQDLTPDAQDLYDWLSEHELSGLEDMIEGSGLTPRDFDKAMLELQTSLYIAPLKLIRTLPGAGGMSELEIEAVCDFLWVTDQHWHSGLERGPRYKSLEYCLSEMKRMLKRHFSTREINNILYKG